MLDIPNKNNLPYYAIAILISACSTLGYMVYNQGKDCERERRADKVEFERRISECQQQARADAREASQALTVYLLRQDSINRANLREISKIRKR